MRIGGLIGAAAAAFVLAGCSYLTGLSDIEEDFNPESPDATYTSGTATLTIAGEVTTLDRLPSAGTYYEIYGADAIWTDGLGWYVRLSGASTTAGFLGPTGYLTLDRIADNAHWTTFDSARCIVSVVRADLGGLGGSATCRGLRWSDAFGGYGLGFEPLYIESEPAFDAELTFAATP